MEIGDISLKDIKGNMGNIVQIGTIEIEEDEK